MVVLNFSIGTNPRGLFLFIRLKSYFALLLSRYIPSRHLINCTGTHSWLCLTNKLKPDSLRQNKGEKGRKEEKEGKEKGHFSPYHFSRRYLSLAYVDDTLQVFFGGGNILFVLGHTHLCLGVTPCSTHRKHCWKTIWDTKDQTHICHMQGKCHTHCTIILSF